MKQETGSLWEWVIPFSFVVCCGLPPPACSNGCEVLGLGLNCRTMLWCRGIGTEMCAYQ